MIEVGPVDGLLMKKNQRLMKKEIFTLKVQEKEILQ